MTRQNLVDILWKVGLGHTVKLLVSHPMNAASVQTRLRAIMRYLRWQVGSRILPECASGVSVRFVNDSRLLVSPGMTGATGNIYCGLHEFQDMAFVLHALTVSDLFVDVGANIGSYTILAGSAVGSRCIAIEPIPNTFRHLQDNLGLNGLTDRVRPLNIGVGREMGRLRFTSAQDTINHVLESEEPTVGSIEVEVRTLDDILAGEAPLLIKIDVEGFETEVIAGGANSLRRPTLQGVIMEVNGSGTRYGYDEKQLHEKMLDFGFNTYSYDPFRRELLDVREAVRVGNNVLYLRDREFIQKRLKAARSYQINGVTL